MKPKIKYLSPSRISTLNFDDLFVGECFKNASSNSKGAIYMKVMNNISWKTNMLELSSGKYFPPTSSPIERVEVEISVKSEKPRV